MGRGSGSHHWQEQPWLRVMASGGACALAWTPALARPLLFRHAAVYLAPRRSSTVASPAQPLRREARWRRRHVCGGDGAERCDGDAVGGDPHLAAAGEALVGSRSDVAADAASSSAMDRGSSHSGRRRRRGPQQRPAAAAPHGGPCTARPILRIPCMSMRRKKFRPKGSATRDSPLYPLI
eukprot:COSAG01_NODE_7887_length_3006_cov_2.260406_1_plen_179_part_10